MNTPHDETRENQTAVALHVLPQLAALADDLEALAREIAEASPRYAPDDAPSVMALSFVTKQREHLRSVRVLLDAKSHRDARLIARTMAEGAMMLGWAFKEKAERPKRWLWFGAIHDWRQIQKNEAAGIAVDPSEKAFLESARDEPGPDYYRGKIRELLTAAEQNGTPFKLPDDPWTKDWTDTTAESMFVAVGAQEVYDTLHRRASEWMHWNIRAILSALAPGPAGVARFSEEDWRAAAAALQAGGSSMLLSLIILDDHFALGLTERLVVLSRISAGISRQIDQMVNGAL